MKVLLTGVNGYTGTHLLPVLLQNGHQVVCLVRDKRHFKIDTDQEAQVQVIIGDLLKENMTPSLPPDIDVACYLMQSTAITPEFSQMEALSAHHFVQALNHTQCKQIVFLGNTINGNNLPQHITDILEEANAALTILQPYVIIGAGSPVLQLIEDIAEKLPVMLMPGWVNKPCRSIAMRDVIGYIEGVLLNPKCYNQTFNIEGPDVLSFKDMILTYAAMRKINFKIIVLPFLPAKLSAWWLSVLTHTNYTAVQTLALSLQGNGICNDSYINHIVPRQCLSYRDALNEALAAGE